MHRRLRCDFTESVSCLDHVQEASRAAPPLTLCLRPGDTWGGHQGGRQGGHEVAPLTLGTQDLSRVRRRLLLVIFPEISPSLVFVISVTDKQTKIYLFGDYLY